MKRLRLNFGLGSGQRAELHELLEHDERSTIGQERGECFDEGEVGEVLGGGGGWRKWLAAAAAAAAAAEAAAAAACFASFGLFAIIEFN